MSFRQGDILLVPGKLPSDAKVASKGNVVLAVGETTGHKHQLSQAILLTKGEEQYVQLEEPAQLTHEEHDQITIPKGTYQVVRQVQYTPQELRRIAD